MAIKNGIILELFPPLSWSESDIRIALEIQEAADEDELANFTQDELTFLAKAVAHYMGTPPASWAGRFSVDTDIDKEDPMENGRYVIDMDYPEHLEPPASLR